MNRAKNRKNTRQFDNPDQCTLYKRIDHIDRIRKAYIMWEDIPLAEICHEYSSMNGDFDWVIKPIWDNWKKQKSEAK